jgi:uncharacterized membrane protein YgdD (TMEM256/DUF423 family)
MRISLANLYKSTKHPGAKNHIMNQKVTLLCGALLGGLGVALGAFGAHALKPVLLENNKLEIYETATRYQLVHALALLIAGALMAQVHHKTLRWATTCWAVGILFFSGSLYALSFRSITAIAYLTPVGGLLFLAGWAFLAVAILKINKARRP